MMNSRRWLTYLQLEQEQDEPQLQLAVPEHPHSPFMMIVLLSWLGSGFGVVLV
jgi:hypothetical protein